MMNRIRQMLLQYMNGRYGGDELNRFMLMCAAVMALLGLFFPIRRIANFVVIMILIVCYIRMSSRNIAKRAEENQNFLRLKDNMLRRKKASGGAGTSAAGGTVFTKKDAGKRILICPFCGEKLKVPVGAGNIRVRCPHCKQEFKEHV